MAGTRISEGTTRRIGYGVAIALNAALLIVVNNILEWGWFSWITADLDRVLGIINVSLIASIVVNAVYVGFDPPWFKGIAEGGLLTISLIAAVRLLQVFPFDFSAYEFDWETLGLWLLGLAIFGICIAIVVRVAQLARMAADALAGEAKTNR